MIRKVLKLAAATLLLPAAAMAAPPARPAEIIVVPVAFAPMPAGLALRAMPAALFRQIDAMQQSMQMQMAAFERLAFAPVSVPQPGTPMSAMPAGYTQVSMVSVGGPGGVCNEQMDIVPGTSGRMQIFIRREGKGCAPEAASLAHAHGASHASAPAPQHRHLPPNALPPPSKLLQAGYLVPGRGRAVG